MSDTIEVMAGPKANVKCTFDGETLELVGYTAEIVRLPVADVNVKRKKRPEKDGGQVFYFLSRLLTSRVELYLQPAAVADMDTLVDALLAAGAGTF
ncbi:MAG: hypothetical protein EXQ79_06935 [Acidimicrobiia bacterium]|nr:hypothetical protein [Acidimicrobiia bacterium]